MNHNENILQTGKKGGCAMFKKHVKAIQSDLSHLSFLEKDIRDFALQLLVKLYRL